MVLPAIRVVGVAHGKREFVRGTEAAQAAAAVTPLSELVVKDVAADEAAAIPWGRRRGQPPSRVLDGGTVATIFSIGLVVSHQETLQRGCDRFMYEVHYRPSRLGFRHFSRLH